MAQWRITPPPAGPRLPFLIFGLGLLVVAAASLSVPAEAAAPIPFQQRPANESCLACHSQPNMLLEVGGAQLLLSVYVTEFDASAHGAAGVACVDCHTDMRGYPHPDYPAQSLREMSLALYEATRPACQNCHREQATKALEGIHQRALEAGDLNAAVCADCHNPHYAGTFEQMERVAIPNTCARCHSQIFATYRASVHGLALIGTGNPDVPSCIDCHGVHNIEDPTTAFFRNETPQLCSRCHTDEAIMGKYGLSTAVLNTYVADFHGTTVTLFEEIAPDQPTNKPVCTDCHGVHNIRRVDDPQAGIAHKENLLSRCQRCHPDVTTENFTDAWLSHYVPSPEKYPLVYYVNLFYTIFIPAVLGGMTFYVVSDIVRRSIERRKGVKH